VDSLPHGAAAVAVAYALVLGLLNLRENRFQELGQVFIFNAKENGGICFIVCAANFLGWLLLRTGLTHKVTAWISVLTSDPMSCFDPQSLPARCRLFSMETIVGDPHYRPDIIARCHKVGSTRSHFGLVMVLNLMIGPLTPTVRSCPLRHGGVSRLPFERVVRATLPSSFSHCGVVPDHGFSSPCHLAAKLVMG